MAYDPHNARQPAFRYAVQTPARHQPSRQSQNGAKRFIFLLALTSSVITLWTLHLANQTALAQLDTAQHLLATESTRPLFVGPKIQPERLQKELGALIAQHPELNISISYKDLRTHRAFQYGSKKTYTAASVGKLVTASLLLDQVDKGQRSLSDSVGGSTARAQLKAMIEVSDNTAWLNLNLLLGYDKLDAYAKKVGLQHYTSYQNTVTAEDIAVLLQKLYSNQLLSKTSTQLLLGHMKVANYRQYIVAAITDGSTVYHKVGFLEDRVHDTAIVDNGKYPYVLVIFTEAKSGSYDFISGGSLIQKITKSVHKTYQKK